MTTTPGATVLRLRLGLCQWTTRSYKEGCHNGNSRCRFSNRTSRVRLKDFNRCGFPKAINRCSCVWTSSNCQPRKQLASSCYMNLGSFISFEFAVCSIRVLEMYLSRKTATSQSYLRVTSLCSSFAAWEGKPSPSARLHLQSTNSSVEFCG